MAIGIVGQKCGMTRIFTEDGVSIPVTVIQATPNRVSQIKTLEKEGYRAIQVTKGLKARSKIKKPIAGHLARAGIEPGTGFWEFRLAENEGDGIELGHEIQVSFFTEGQKVDVIGITKGKGFAGVIKRHHFRTQDASHGNSLAHRAPGSIGQNQTPGRVFKGKKMAGQLGNVRRTVQNLDVVRVDKARHLLLIRGAVPGAIGGNVIVRPAVKMKKATSSETK